MNVGSLQGDSVYIVIDRFEGSSPREVGAGMLVSLSHVQGKGVTVQGTVGGGRLEFDAIERARQWLQTADFKGRDETHRYALGPSLGQCCGGVVWLRFVGIAAEDTAKLIANYAIYSAATEQNTLKIALFGGGHVGKAIVQVLGNLPCRVHWIDSRDEIFPESLPANIKTDHSAPVQAAVHDLAPHSHLLIMSFSHAEDLDVVAAALKRQREKSDLRFIGLIASKTKWATFRARLRERGFSDAELAHVTCPIGVPGVVGKEPEVIAVAVAAQLMQFRPA